MSCENKFDLKSSLVSKDIVMQYKGSIYVNFISESALKMSLQTARLAGKWSGSYLSLLSHKMASINKHCVCTYYIYRSSINDLYVFKLLTVFCYCFFCFQVLVRKMQFCIVLYYITLILQPNAWAY